MTTGRKPDDRFAARRAEIGDAVWRVVAERGLEGLTVRAIAREMGVTTGVISHHFVNKEELLGFALGLFFDEIDLTLEAALNAGGAPLENLLEAARRALPVTPERLSQWTGWLGFLGRVRLDERHAREHASRYGEVRRRLARVVRHAVDDGSLPQDADPDTEAEMMLAFVDGLGVHATLEPFSFPPARQLRLVELYLRGRGAQPGRRL